MRLALAMGRTVGELYGAVSPEEWQEWQAYDAIEPIGERREDMRHIVRCELMRHLWSKTEGKNLSARAWLPWLPAAVQNVQQMFMGLLTSGVKIIDKRGQK